MPNYPVLPTTVANKSAAYTLEPGVCLVMGDPSSAGFTITIPTEENVRGRWLIVWNITTSTNGITVDAETGNINGSSTVATNASREALLLVCDGSNWFAVQCPIPS